MTGIFLRTSIFFLMVRAVGFYSRLLCPQLDGDRITNCSKIGDGHRVTDYKVFPPNKTRNKMHFVLEYRRSIGTTQRSLTGPHTVGPKKYISGSKYR